MFSCFCFAAVLGAALVVVLCHQQVASAFVLKLHSMHDSSHVSKREHVSMTHLTLATESMKLEPYVSHFSAQPVCEPFGEMGGA